MPICERDPWRDQFFEGVVCPDDVLIPTDDPDCWNWYPRYRWVYDKLKIAESQRIACGPHGVSPSSFPVFSKPIVNLKGMAMGTRLMRTAGELDSHYVPGHMWMENLEGAHVSTDCAITDGKACWFRHAAGEPGPQGTFRHWTIYAAEDTCLEDSLAAWIAREMVGYTGMMNFETIGGRIIEAHLRFADQWCDLYGAGWTAALVRLYEHGNWSFEDAARRTGYSVPLFARHGAAFRHPPMEAQASIRQMPDVASLQITFHEDRDPESHPMPPGGFRLGIVNGWSLAACFEARNRLAECFPAEMLLLGS